MTQEQAWEFQAVERALNDGDYLTGISDFKSSLKREIEKRIKSLEFDASLDYSDESMKIINGKLTECIKFLELLNTVEP
jgi:hypothetical protein